MPRVKFITKNHGQGDWLRQMPSGQGELGTCRFIFDVNCQEYDWLVVYDDFPKKVNGRKFHYESLVCPAAKTILVTSEPESIKRYERAYVRQFGQVLTSQSPQALPHPRAVRGPSTSLWYYGQGGAERLTVDDMRAGPPEKSAPLSTVCSDKQQKHTLHYRRWQFTQTLRQELPQLEIFGHGVRPMRDKAEAMDDFKYHIAIENFYGPHHWTEKLSDCFLAGCLPFYYGCPNAEDYFPAESFIRIDIDDPLGAAKTIRQAIDQDAYALRRDAVLEARRRVLEEHNLFARLARLIETESSAHDSLDPRQRLYSRHAARWRAPCLWLRERFQRLARQS